MANSVNTAAFTNPVIPPQDTRNPRPMSEQIWMQEISLKPNLIGNNISTLEIGVGAAYAQANLATALANTGIADAEAAYTQANAAYTQANSAYAGANTANGVAQTASNTANAAYAQANSVANITAGQGIVITSNVASVNEGDSFIWNGSHQFEGNTARSPTYTGVSIGQIAGFPEIVINDSTAAANCKVWEFIYVPNTLIFRTITDDLNTYVGDFLTVLRANANIISINIGNQVDNPTVTLYTESATITGNIAAANATINSISFIPSWTAPTVNSSYNAAVTGYNSAGYWIDPFGIVHLRGAIANGSANIALTSMVNVNIANGLPIPTANVMVGCVGANTTNATGMFHIVVCANGALQALGNTGFASGNLGILSLEGMEYSIH